MTILVLGTIAFDTVASVGVLPAKDATARVLAVTEAPGGAAGNVALGLARLGVTPTLASVVGDDFAGSDYERALLAAGVDLSRVARVRGLSARAYLFSDPQGSQHIYFFPGAAHDSAALGQPRPARVGHFAAGDVSAYPAHMEACDVVTFDPGQEVFHRDLADVERCLPLVDHLFLNEHELARLAAERGWTAPRLLELGVATVVETRGAAGALLHRAGRESVVVPAAPARLVDPTGAGDAHRAGFVAALVAGADVETAARVGSVVAAFAVEAQGPQAGAPTLEDVRARYVKTFGAFPW